MIVELEELNVDAIEQELELSRAALESQALAESEAKAEQGDSEKADGKSGEAVMEEIENFELEIDGMSGMLTWWPLLELISWYPVM